MKKKVFLKRNRENVYKQNDIIHKNEVQEIRSSDEY